MPFQLCPYNSKYPDIWITFQYMHYIFELSLWVSCEKQNTKKKVVHVTFFKMVISSINLKTCIWPRG